MYQKEMKPVIIKTLDTNVHNICTYKGYDGADILKLSFHDNQELLMIRQFCKDRKIETATKMIHGDLELYVIFEVPDDIYALK